MALLTALKGPWNPFRITGTAMPPNLLLLCKILAVALLATGHVRILPDPFLPFIPGLDGLTDPAIFKGTLQTVVVVAAVALLFNRCVRASTLILGGCVLLAVLSSKAYYGNNKTFVGLALILAGLSDFDRPPYLLRWQLALVYFGAAVNKLLLEDWQNGLFFAYWGEQKVRNPLYLELVKLVPSLLAGKIMCWGIIAGEFFIAVGVLIPRLVPWALWVNVLFQFGLLQFTGGTFTLFFYAMQAATLAFVTWPRPESYLQQMDGSGVDIIAICRRLLFSPTFWLVGTTALGLLDVVALPPGCAPVLRRLLATTGLLVALVGYFGKGWTFGRKAHTLNDNERFFSSCRKEYAPMQKREKAVTFKGNPLTLLGPQLKVGDTAPDFACVTQGLEVVNLAKTAGKTRLFSAVPSLDTPVCSEETRRFDKEMAALGDKVACYTVSLDLPFAQKRFCSAENISNVQTLSDVHNQSFGKNYGTLIEGLPIPLLSRALFVVDKNNKITYCEYVPEVASHPNYDKAIQALKAAG